MKKTFLLSLLFFPALLLIITGCSNPTSGGTSPSEEETIIYAPALPDTFYVRPGGTGDKDGSSWENAFAELQEAINAAYAEATIAVPKYVLILGGATYYPASGGSGGREKHFSLRDNVTVIGGFRGDEIDMIPLGEATVLSGDIGVKGDKSDNAYHVFYHPDVTNLDATAVLKHVTITDGNADGSYPHNSGAGMFNSSSSSPTVENCTFGGNSASSGGGMYNNISSSPTVENCTFSGNSVSSGGGGMYNNNSSSPTVENCIFDGNSAHAGGGMYNSSSNPTVETCTFSSNSGDGMNNYNSSPTVDNCIFSSNSSGGMFNHSSSPTVDNCIFSNNSGGGMYNFSSSPAVENCTFNDNSTSGQGGGMHNKNNSSPTVENCTFSGNSANSGGGMYNYNSSPTAENCTFNGNSATSGGGMFNSSSSDPVVKNCTFGGNSADAGGGMYNSSSSPKVYGCILVGNFKIGDSSVDEIAGTAFAVGSTDNLIRGTAAAEHDNYGKTFIGDIGTLFARIDGSGKAELWDNGGPTQTLMIKESYADARFSIPSGGEWAAGIEVPSGDQRGYTRSIADNAGYKGAVDPRAGP